MRAARLARVVLICGLAVPFSPVVQSIAAASDVDDLLDRAEQSLRLGVVEQGATRAFVEASILLDTAVTQLAASNETADERRRLTREIAWLRHRYAVARGTEEPEPSAEEAAQADQERLEKLSKKLTRKL